jgi:hypothetical protein
MKIPVIRTNCTLFSRFFTPNSLFGALLGENGVVTNLLRSALLLLLLASGPCFAQNNVKQLISDSIRADEPFNINTYKPLTGHERWHKWLKEDGAGPSLYVDAVGIATFKQAINSPAEWGRTPRGYFQRTGSSLASGVIEHSITDTLAAVAGTDTRYFACACSGFFPRTGHALKMTFFTYTSHGHLTLDGPQLAGAYGSSMIKAEWYPASHDPLVQGVQDGHLSMGLNAGINIFLEFAPEFKRILHLPK